MKTNQIMKRNFLGAEIRQQHQTGYFSEKDITALGTLYRKNQGLSEARWDNYVRTKQTKEFFSKLMQSENNADIIKVSRGRNSQRWIHPFIFLDYCMYLSPDFKITALGWIEDKLTIFRDDSGESYKEMSKALFSLESTTPARAAIMIQDLARAIKRDIGVEDWNKATPEQLKKRDEVHKSMILALKMGVEPQVAYKTIKEGL